MDVTQQRPPAILRGIASFLSYVFHPIFIPLYVIGFIVFLHPVYMTGFPEKAKWQIWLITLLNTVMFPLLCIGLLKALGFINSFFLRTQKDRIIPYIACSIFFFWTYTVFKEQPAIPRILASFMLGVFLSSNIALIANIYYKVSMHAIGVGGWLGLFFVILRSNSMLMTWPMSVALLIAGLVCTSRLLVSDHTQKDIYSGLAFGFFSQLTTAFILL